MVLEKGPDGYRDDLPEVMSANVLTAHYAIRNFLPLLQKGEMKKIANM